MDERCTRCDGLTVLELAAMEERTVPPSPEECQKQRWWRRPNRPVELVAAPVYQVRCLNCGHEIFVT
jgi:hypothetical protein